MSDWEIRTANPGDFDGLTSLLRAAGLPVEDLSCERMDDFLVALSGHTIVGVVGLEAFSRVGLLRSLVVDRASRTAGVGRSLVAALEAHARLRGVEDVWLLTIDADRYFRALGYVTSRRRYAPRAIRETAEFSKLCPGSATLMHKRI